MYTLLGIRAYNTVWSGDTASDVTGPTVILNDSLSVSVVEVMVAKYYKRILNYSKKNSQNIDWIYMYKKPNIIYLFIIY